MQEILNEINILNSKIETIISSLDSISENISSFYPIFQNNIINLSYLSELSQLSDLLSPESFLDRYSSGIFGLIGVIIGAIITYYFNKKISREKRVGRIAVQRKNLIYAPLYKELFQLEKYIKKHSGTCYLHILNKEEECHQHYIREYYYDGKRHQGACFIVWNDMKNDVRKDYIPVTIQESLEKINENLSTYIKNKDKIDSDFQRAFNNSKINEIYGEADRKKHGKPKVDSKIDLNTLALLFKKDGKPLEGLEEVYKRWSTFREDKEYSSLRKELKRFFTNLPKEIDRKEFFKSYEELVTSIFEAKEKISELIKHIVNKYEYGEELGKI